MDFTWTKNTKTQYNEKLWILWYIFISFLSISINVIVNIRQECVFFFFFFDKTLRDHLLSNKT